MITVITLLLASNHYFRKAYYTEGSFVLSLDFLWACFSQSSLSLQLAELEQRVIEAESRAEDAEGKVRTR